MKEFSRLRKLSNFFVEMTWVDLFDTIIRNQPGESDVDELNSFNT